MFKFINVTNLKLAGNAIVSNMQINLYTLDTSSDLDLDSDEYITGNVSVSVDTFDADAYGDGHIEQEIQHRIADELGIACEVSWSEDGLQSEEDCVYDFDITFDTDDLQSVINSFEE